MIRASTVITALLCLLSVLHGSDEAHNELFGHAFDAIWVFAINVFLLAGAIFLQVCHLCRGHCCWLAAFELPQREEACHPGLTCTGHRWVLRCLHCLILLGFPCHLEVIGVHLLITASLEVCHHHFKLLRHPTVEVVMLQFGDVIWQKVLWE